MTARRKKAGGDAPKTEATMAVAEAYKPTREEAAALAAYRASKSPARLKVAKTGDKTSVGPDHPDAKLGSVLLLNAVGTTNPDFLEGLLRQLVSAGSQGQNPDELGINFMLAVVQSIGPKDEVETMLAAQMAAVHMATMTFARRLAHVENIPQQDSAERAFNKLARTFTTQMEALKRYRSGGQQKVTVEHVHVHAGGQAIVGAVEAGGGVASGNQRQPHAKPLSHAPVTPLWSQNPEWESVPVAGNAER